MRATRNNQKCQKIKILKIITVAEAFHGFALTLLIPSLSAPRTRSETRYKKNGRTIPQLSVNGGKNTEESGQSCRQTTELRKEAPHNDQCRRRYNDAAQGQDML
jgi:hypothetical protein